jgi:hypothetical protein
MQMKYPAMIAAQDTALLEDSSVVDTLLDMPV